jgi:hypothetical protein
MRFEQPDKTLGVWVLSSTSQLCIVVGEFGVEIVRQWIARLEGQSRAVIL